MNLEYRNLGFRIGGRRISHLDFEKANDPKILEQMLINAVLNMGWHAEDRHDRQTKAFAECIDVGFKHAKKILRESYHESRLPQANQLFEKLKEDYRYLM